MVTGSCFSLSTKEEKILIDCGMFQGSKDMQRRNYEEFDFNPSEYTAMILTHAHLDHCGRIPQLVKRGFKGKIFTTDATTELVEVILLDAAKIAAEDTYHENKRRAKEGLPPRQPIYNESDVKKAMKLFYVVKYDEDVKVSQNIIARFYDAGHILGSACVGLKVHQKKNDRIFVFSGDLGQENAILVKNPEPITKADYVLVESTYGDRLHPPIEDRKKDLIKAINNAYKRGGKLMIPSFAVERAQEIIYDIGEYMNEGLIPKMDVYLDSPMAMKATKVFTKYPQYYNEGVQKTLRRKKNPFEFKELKIIQTVDESKELNSIEGPCIIIAGNGMCTAGRIKHHIRNGINNPKNTILFIGYQVEGTLGYWIKKGEKKIRLLGGEVDVKAKVESIEGFSAHADYNGSIKWLKNFSPKPEKVFVVHGNEEQSAALAKRLEKEGYACATPSLLDKVEI